MSMPITRCLAVKAVDDEGAFKELLRRIVANWEKGGWSVWPCEHDPKCRELTAEEQNALEERLVLALADDLEEVLGDE